MSAMQRYYDLIAAIPDEKLREAVADSAMTNAGDTAIELHLGACDPEMWEIAINTAKMILDDPKSFYPELFA